MYGSYLPLCQYASNASWISKSVLNRRHSHITHASIVKSPWSYREGSIIWLLGKCALWMSYRTKALGCSWLWKSVMRKLVWLSITQCWVTFLDPGTLLCTFPIDSFQNTLWETQIQKNGIWWGSQVHFGGSFLAHTALGLRPRALFFILTSIFKDVSVCMFLCVYTHMCRVPIKTENSMGLPWS